MKNQNLPALYWIFLFVFMAGIVSPGVHAFDEFADFSDAKNAYEAGEYETAVERFEGFLKKSPANEALIIDSHKYLGVCYIFLDNEENAEDHFTKLLNRDPSFSLDPLVFPIDVVDFFSGIKREQGDRLAQLAVEKAKEDAKRKKEEEEQKRLEMERLTRMVYLQKTVHEGSLLVSYMPFGAGQFQNGHKGKGIVFLSGELVLVAAAITTYALHESLRDRSTTPFYSSEAREETEKYEKGYRIANQVSLISLGVMIIVGIVDSVYHFESQKESWKTIDEKDVPKKYRHKSPPKGAISPVITENSIGLSAVGYF